MTAETQRERNTARRLDELDQELIRFIDYGVLLDRRTRRYLAEIIRHKAIDGPAPEIPPLMATGDEEPTDLDSSYARYFTDAVDRLFSNDALIEICRSQAAVGVQLATETLRWMRKTSQRIDRGERHDKERSIVSNLAHMPLSRFLASYTSILNDLSGRYKSHEIDVDFYRSALDDIAKPPPSFPLDSAVHERVEMLIHDLLAAWDALLSAKMLADQLSELEEARDEFIDGIGKRVDEHQRIQSMVSPFVDYLDRGWDLSRGLWEQADLDVLAEYATLLEQEDDLRALAELLGRMHDAEVHRDEEEIAKQVHTKRWITDEYRRAEIVGVRESDDLSNILSSEVALAGEPELEDRFLQKLVDKRLMTFSLADRRLVQGPKLAAEEQSQSHRQARGPLIMCVDTSYSMSGRAELLAKVLAFGILRVAIEEDREAYLINFSVQINTLDLRDAGRNIDSLADFLRMSFHGGTDVTLALAETLRKLDEGRYRDADVIVVSDFIMYRVPRPILEAIRSQQHNRGTRFHALTFNDIPNPEIMECFQTAWFSDPNRPGVIEEIAENIHEIRRGNRDSIEARAAQRR